MRTEKVGFDLVTNDGHISAHTIDANRYSSYILLPVQDTIDTIEELDGLDEGDVELLGMLNEAKDAGLEYLAVSND